jgi:phage/plasmid-associated DNA primase
MEPATSPLLNKNFRQCIPMEELEALLSAKNVSKQDLKILGFLKNNQTQGYVAYTLEEPKGTWGRLSSKNTIFQLSRQVRHYLCRNEYYDIDMKNAQANVLMCYCNHHGIRCDKLTEFVKTRDALFQRLLDSFSISKMDITRINQEYPDSQCYTAKDVLKKITYIIINGGSLHNFLTKLNKVVPKDILDFFTEFEKEQRLIYQMATKIETKLFKDIQKKSKENTQGSFMAMLYQELEKRILGYAVPVEDNDIFIYELDGFKVLQESLTSESIRQQFLKTLTDNVVKNMGDAYKDIEFCIKPMDEAIELEIISEEEKELLEVFETLQVKEIADQVCAKIFYEKFKDCFVYSQSIGWMFCDKDTNIWKEIPKITDMVSQYFNLISDLFSERLEEKKQPAFKKLLGSAGLAKRVEDLLQDKFLKDDMFMSKFESKKNLFAFSDGMVVDLNTMEVEKIQSTDYITTHCGYPYKNFKEISTKTAKNFIYSIQETEEKAEALLSFLASSLYGENRQNGFIILKGTGGNGKSVMDTLMRLTLGGYYQTIPITELTALEKEKGRANAELFKCKYARYVSCSEPENAKTETLKISTIKKLTGNESISVRTLHKTPITFVPHFTLFLSLQMGIKLSNSDDGIARRLQIVDFPYRFRDASKYDPEDPFQKLADDTLSEKLNSEDFKYSMLKLLFTSYKANNGRYRIIESIKNETNEYLVSSHPLKKWFDANYECSEDSFITTRDLYNDYCLTESQPLSEKMFSIELERFANKKRTNKGIVYKLKKKNSDNDCMIEKEI